jgi:hypothetical protein
MAKSSKIRVMISSRCNDMFPLSSKPQVRLSDLRTKMKKEIEGTNVLGTKPYEVWINEDAAESAELDALDECLRQARECDIFVVKSGFFLGWAQCQTQCRSRLRARWLANPTSETTPPPPRSRVWTAVQSI